MRIAYLGDPARFYVSSMSIPFQGYNRYVCHICKKWFEFPNPLKVHIALKCDQLDINHLWTELENEFNLTMRPYNTQSVAVPPNGSARAMEIETIINNLEKSSKGYSCFYCGKICKTKHNLKIHIRLISYFIFSVI
jgi:PR domain zinc finger protein 13